MRLSDITSAPIDNQKLSFSIFPGLMILSPSCLHAIPSLGETLGLPLMADHGQLGAMSLLAKQRMM